MRSAFASDFTGYFAGILPDRDSFVEDNAFARVMNDLMGLNHYHSNVSGFEQRRRVDLERHSANSYTLARRLGKCIRATREAFTGFAGQALTG
jgi:hypothetical protein